ncbi:winged helix-turn-helix domain-containing protein [Nonomuraea thailandensis]
MSAATASAHLAKLLDGRLVDVVRQGRHRYYRLAGHEIAEVLEVLAGISARPPVRSLRQSRQARMLEEARTCYDHLAGRAGVGLLDRLREGGYYDGQDVTEAGSGCCRGWAWTSRARAGRGGASRRNASTGPSAGRTSAGRSARRSRRCCSSGDGTGGERAQGGAPHGRGQGGAGRTVLR